MHVVIDATPLIGSRTGIGRYTEHLISNLVHQPGVSLTLTAFTLRGRNQLPQVAGTRTKAKPVPARLLREAWIRGNVPPIEWLTGRCDVVHGTNFVVPPARKAARVVTVHDLAYLRFQETVDATSLAYQGLVARAAREGAHFLAPSSVTKTLLMSHYPLADDQVTVTPLGVEQSWFEAMPGVLPQASDIFDGRPYLLFVGTVEPRKNLPVLLDAFRELVTQFDSPPRLVLAGPAGWGEPLPDLPPGTVQMGWLEQHELQTLVAGCAALVMPSKDEGFGLPVIEGLAAGRPVVCSDLDVLREVGGPHVLTAQVNDAGALARACERAMTSPDDAEAREQRRQWARQFTWQRCAELTVEGYRRALSHTAPR